MKTSATNGKKTRPPTVEGLFYPQDEGELKGRLRELLHGFRRRGRQKGTAQSIISPHAAYDYSGRIAASAFAAAAGRNVETAVLLGPVHREPVEAVILPESQAFQTPLGTVEVQEELLLSLLRGGAMFRRDDIPHLEEHCLEVQLPFLQQLFPAAKVLPILVGQAEPKLVQLLADTLWGALSERLDSTLFVVSANMTTYRGREEGERELAETLELIRGLQWQALLEGTARKRLSSCGAAGIAAILLLHRRLGGRVEVLETGSSLDATGDAKKVVYYAGIALTDHRE
jgi:AmmeMemoRadiSam system protein B